MVVTTQNTCLASIYRNITNAWRCTSWLLSCTGGKIDCPICIIDQYFRHHWGCIKTHWPLGDLNVILKNVNFNLALLIAIFKSSHDNVLRWMPQDLTDGYSTLVQVMAWCRQATSHYLNQCWPRSPTPYGVTRPQWVNCCRCPNT